MTAGGTIRLRLRKMGFDTGLGLKVSDIPDLVVRLSENDVE